MSERIKYFKTYTILKHDRRIVELDNINTLYDVMQNILDINKQYVNSMILQKGTFKGYKIITRKETSHERYARRATEKSFKERS